MSPAGRQLQGYAAGRALLRQEIAAAALLHPVARGGGAAYRQARRAANRLIGKAARRIAEQRWRNHG